MAFRVEIQPQALEDLDSIASYITSQSSLTVAERWFNGIIEEIASLKEMPGRCPTVFESEALGREVRMLLYGRKNRSYKVFYSIRFDTPKAGVVDVLHVRHWARRPAVANVFEELLSDDR